MSDQSWTASNLGELFTINTDGVAPNTSPSTEFHHHSLPAWDEFGGPAVEKGSSIESDKTRVTKPCVLVSKLNPRKPRVSVVEAVPDEEHHCASTEFVCLEPKSEEPLNFWGHLFSNKSFSDNLDRIAIGSTNSHKRYSPKALLSQRIKLPPVPERRLIAHILDTLDTQIQKTGALIAKLEKVKEGLLHDILTRGIDENGRLRPSPEQAPELYKDSPLGLIPREWVPSNGAQACKEIVVGIVIKPTQYYRASGVPILRSANVRENRISLDNLMYMAQQDHKAMSKSAVKPGDVLTVRTGYPGTSCVVDGSLEEANCVDIIISRVGESLDPNFWALWINSDFGKGHVLKSQGGLAQQHFNVGDLKKIQLPIPTMPEQLKIVGTWRALQEQIQKESTRLEKLQLQKTGLMDDLLIGRVRVTPLLDQAQVQATPPA